MKNPKSKCLGDSPLVNCIFVLKGVVRDGIGIFNLNNRVETNPFVYFFSRFYLDVEEVHEKQDEQEYCEKSQSGKNVNFGLNCAVRI